MADNTGFCSLYKILVGLWFFLLLISFILIMVGLFIEEGFVEGNNVEVITNGVKQVGDVNVGLFRQCFDAASGGSDCFNILPQDININTWEAASAFFILGIIFLFFTLVVVLVCMCVYKALPWAKTMHSLTNLWFMIAITLIPIGFAWLDDQCPSGNEQGQCGLVCYGDDDFSFFTLCGPYDIAEGLQVLLAGIFLLFLTSFIALCVQVRQTVVEVKQVTTGNSYA